MSCGDCNEFAKVCAVAGSTVALLARIKKPTDATYITQATTSSVRVDVYEMSGDTATPVDSDGEEITDGSAYASPAVSAVVYDTLQTDARWDVDSTGYNLAYKFTAPTRDTRYEVRVKLTLSNGDTVVVVYDVTAK